MRGIDEWILDKVAQPVADWLNKKSVSHLTVAGYALSLALLSVCSHTMAMYQEGWLFSGFGCLLMLFDVFWAAGLWSSVNLIWKDRSRIERGNLAIPTARATFVALRLQTTLFMMPSLALVFDTSRASDFTVGALDLSAAVGLYLWATLPRPPSRDTQTETDLSHAEGAA